MQIKGDIHWDDKGTPKPGTLWPGELVELDLQGHPSLPDGIYRMRLMEMQGDASDKATLTFDMMPVPLFNTTHVSPSVQPPATAPIRNVTPTSIRIEVQE